MKAGCIAVADFVGVIPSANKVDKPYLPSPPKTRNSTPATTFEAEGVKLD